MNILLIVNQQKDKDFELANKIIGIIDKRADVYVPEEEKSDLLKDVKYVSCNEYKNMDIFLVLGGDGTLLGISKTAAELNIPVVGVNLGRLGFLSEIEKEDIRSDIEKILNKDFTIQERTMLRACINGEGKNLALNDIIFARGNSSLKILDFDVYLDDEFIDNFKADGLIVSTPTGSTAYSLSAGGPIVDPSMDVIIITPICPHKMYSRTIVVSSNKTVTVKNRSSEETQTIIAADSEIIGEITKDDSVIIKSADEKFKLIRLHGFKFFSVLHNKLVKKEN